MFVKRNFPDLLHIIDDHVQEECKGLIQRMVETDNVLHWCLLSLVQIALSCTHLFPGERMNMKISQ